MFSIEFAIKERLDRSPAPASLFSSFSVAKVRLLKLMTTVFSQLTWDVPILHPTRSNVLLILALPPDIPESDIISFIQRTNPAHKFSVFLLKHSVNSALIEFECQADADKFYVKSLGIAFDRCLSHVNCILLFIYRVCCPDLPILPMKTMKESERIEFELPMCPLCFKLFDPLISCFFSGCGGEDVTDEAYTQWGCPPCQICNKIHRPENFSALKCTQCDEKSKLWICMCCGHVGCERDSNRHAIEHYNETKHRFAFRCDRMWLWDYYADRSVDRSFHTPPTSNEGIVDNYRDLLVNEIIDLHSRDQREKEKLKNEFGDKISQMKEELQAITDECDALQIEYTEAAKCQAELTAIMTKMNEIKKSKKMIDVESLEKANASYKAKLAHLSEQQQQMFLRLEGRSDVTNQVVIDIEK